MKNGMWCLATTATMTTTTIMTTTMTTMMAKSFDDAPPTEARLQRKETQLRTPKSQRNISPEHLAVATASTCCSKRPPSRESV